jgi:hypothetical protein
VKGGGATKATLNQALHWNGHSWFTVTVPSPSKGTRKVSVLNGVRCTSSSNCWAVGYYFMGSAVLTQALRWNGSHWSQWATPNPGGTAGFDSSQLFSVTCVSASSCWAAGQYGFEAIAGVVRNLVLHWNGSKWTKASVPDPAGTQPGDISTLSSVRCGSPASCWAVGTYGTQDPAQAANQVLHWNGSKWGMAAAPSPGGSAAGHISFLYGLACASVSNCWAVGTYGIVGTTSTYKNQVMHWNGHHWSLWSAAQPDGSGTGASNMLNDVTCPTAVSCWAVGSYGSIDSGGVGVVLNQVQHWNGHHWSLVSTPDPAGLSDGDSDQLFGVRCAAASNCWAVGNAQPVDKIQVNEALHWNGGKWSAG